MSVRPFVLATLCCVALAACTNERTDVTALSIAKEQFSRKDPSVVSDPAQVAQSVQEALNVLEGPLALATFEKTQNNVVLRQIQTNGPYTTWTSWGGNERRSVTTRNGMITATRGLMNDLMSSDVTASLSLVSARQSGSATRVQRYLDGENHTVSVTANCTITRGERTRVQAGSIDRMAVEMTESCETGERSFRNLYRVDDSGRILQSVQWLNDTYGSTVIQVLR